MRSAALLALALLLSLLLGEGMLRLALDEVNYLRPTVVPHPILGHVINPRSGGHDEWGFRNTEVPERADIVAIGDSQTYGTSTMATQAWPAWLAKLSGKTVYNMALGGYGPPDYLYLLKNKAVLLSPKIVLVGVYLGNDLLRSYEDATGRPSNAVSFDNDGSERHLGRLRNWLSRNSMTYQVVKNELPSLIGRLRSYEESATLSEGQFLFEGPKQRTIFEVSRRLRSIDQALEKNRIGLARTLEIAAEIYRESEAHSITCLIVIVPTKESVYWPLAQATLPEHERAQMDYLVNQEKLAHDEIVAFLERQHAPFVDVLPAMREATNELALYPAHSDGHPLGEGHRVIASEIYRRLSELNLLQ